MPKVAIVTDSSAYIPEEMTKELNISIAPLVVIWGQEELLDGVDITADEFYKRLETSEVMPSTSQATPRSFVEAYTPLHDQGHEILSIHISEKLSGTVPSANQAKQMLPDDATIEIIDSYSTTMALGYQVLMAARAAADGASLADCKEIAYKARENSGVVFAVDTLEFLHRGGRIGGASKFLGTALKLKPILEVRDGKVDSIERVRTRKKSIARMVDLVEERIDGKQPVRLASLDANAEQDADAILEIAAERFGAIEKIYTSISPAIGTHTGPGTVGLAYLAGM